MTFLLKDIADHFIGSADVVDTVSNRIFPDVIPQEVRNSLGQKVALYPCIVLTIVSNVPDYYLAGESGKHTSVVQVDCWADGEQGTKEANDLAELVRNRFSGYRGRLGTGCYGTARLIRSDPSTLAPVDGSDTHRRRVSMDFEIIHTADVPDLT